MITQKILVSLLISLAVLFFYLIFLIWRNSRPNGHHRRMLRMAAKSLKKLKEIGQTNPAALFGYIRKMHPHAVEELVLNAAKEAGHKIRRNKAYTGDGGFDGQIMVDDRWHLVQTKRYGSAINPAHVEDFSILCRQRRQPGLFIHCGRTGPKSHANKSSDVRIISGDDLVQLILGRSLSQNEPKRGPVAKNISASPIILETEA